VTPTQIHKDIDEYSPTSTATLHAFQAKMKHLASKESCNWDNLWCAYKQEFHQLSIKGYQSTSTSSGITISSAGSIYQSWIISLFKSNTLLQHFCFTPTPGHNTLFLSCSLNLGHYSIASANLHPAKWPLMLMMFGLFN
jgi:hypothetical protein